MRFGQQKAVHGGQAGVETAEFDRFVVLCHITGVGGVEQGGDVRITEAVADLAGDERGLRAQCEAGDQRKLEFAQHGVRRPVLEPGVETDLFAVEADDDFDAEVERSVFGRRSAVTDAQRSGLRFDFDPGPVRQRLSLLDDTLFEDDAPEAPAVAGAPLPPGGEIPERYRIRLFVERDLNFSVCQYMHGGFSRLLLIFRWMKRRFSR